MNSEGWCQTDKSQFESTTAHPSTLSERKKKKIITCIFMLLILVELHYTDTFTSLCASFVENVFSEVKILIWLIMVGHLMMKYHFYNTQ